MYEAIRFAITADARTAAAMQAVQNDLRGVRGALAGVRDHADRAGRAMRNIGLGMSAAITAPLTLLGTQAVQLFDAQVKAQQAVEAAVRSTGNAAGLSADELFRMASGLQSVTTYGDEDILQNVTAPLLTFTKVSGETFNRAQAAILDMATLMGTDLTSAAVQVGKALNDPVKGISALSRVGVQLSAEQDAQIRRFVEINDLASAQAIILGELETQFGGQAAAMAATPLGQWQQLSNAIGDVKEQLGEQIVPFLTPLVGKVQQAVDWFSALSPEVKRNIVVFGGLAAAAGPVLAILGTAVLGVTALGSAFAILASPLALVGAVIVAVAGGAALLYAKWDGVSAWFADALEGVRASFGNLGAYVGDVFGADQEAARARFLAAWDGTGTAIGAVWAAITTDASARIKALLAILSGQFSLANLSTLLANPLAAWAAGLWPSVSAAFAQGWQSLKATLTGWPAELFEIGRQAGQGLIDGLLDMLPGIERTGATAGRNLSRAARSELGIQSPSRVFREIGAQVIEGLRLGIEQTGPAAVAAMSGVTGQIEQVGKTTGPATQAFQGLFRSILSGAQSAEQALASMLQTVASRQFDAAVNVLVGSVNWDGMFGGFFGNLFGSAKGNAFASGSVVPFANGGVVSAPTLFPMSGARTGLMGEAGPEAIMPLSRGPDGRLGVRASGAGGASVNVEVHVHNVPADRRADVRTSQDGRRIDVVLREEVRDMIERGDLDGPMRRTFGVRRMAAAGL
jgi:hypothetical protein